MSKPIKPSKAIQLIINALSQHVSNDQVFYYYGKTLYWMLDHIQRERFLLMLEGYETSKKEEYDNE